MLILTLRMRIAVLKDNTALSQLPDDDTNVFQKSLIVTDISIDHKSLTPCV